MTVRVLIVDDSIVIRTMLAEIFDHETGIEVVGTAANGVQALERLERLAPDVVLLDIEMPKMDGLEFLSRARTIAPRVAVLVVSSVTHRGAVVTIDALSRGARDYIPKPSSVAGARVSFEETRTLIVQKIRAITAASAPSAPPPRRRPTPRRPAKVGPVDIVALGISTGGPEALSRLFSALGRALPVPMIVVQHMPPHFTEQLARSLAHRSGLAVREAADGELVEGADVWIARGGYHLRLERDEESRVRLITNQDDSVHGLRPAVDITLDSIADLYGARTLAVIMTGMGRDGVEGARKIAGLGGEIWAQDEYSSVVWGMAGQVVKEGLADEIVALDDLPERLMRRTTLGYLAPVEQAGQGAG